MHKKAAVIISLVIILSILFAYATMYLTPTPTLSVDPQTISKGIDQDFTINMAISDVADLYAWQFKLNWNATILDFVNITEGSFLQSGGNTFFNPRTNTSSLGYIFVFCTRTLEAIGVNGKGILATVTFHVRTSGHCILNLSETILLNSAEKQIVHRTIHSNFNT